MDSFSQVRIRFSSSAVGRGRVANSGVRPSLTIAETHPGPIEVCLRLIRQIKGGGRNAEGISQELRAQDQ